MVIKMKKTINNQILMNKKGFVFVFLAFFFAIIIFALAYLNLFEGDYTKDNFFTNARISSIDQEMKYFKNTYIKSAVAFSLYNTIDALMNYTRDDINYQKINQNYSKFNELIIEGMMNGTFDGEIQSQLINHPNKTLSYFIDIYQKNFNEAHSANFTFEILNINVYEEMPYYVSIKIFANYSVETYDNISSWHSEEVIDASVPIYGLDDPLFDRYADEKVPLYSSEYTFYADNWTIDVFETLLNESYTTIYFDKDYKYSIGGSFLNNFLNYSGKSYKDVIGFWSFDYDVEENKVYDTANYNNVKNSNFFGNTRLALDFHDESIFGDVIKDRTPYQNNVSIIGTTCGDGVVGIRNNGCNFDGTGDYLLVENSNKLDISKEFSISLWLKPNFLNQNYVNSTLVRMSKGDFSSVGLKDGFALLYNNITNQISFSIGNTTDYTSVLSSNLSKSSSWMNIVAVYDLNELRIYQNGFLIGKTDTNIKEIKYMTDNLSIGGWHEGSNGHFNGFLDEINVFSKALSLNDIFKIYQAKEIFYVDYIDSFQGKGVVLDGLDDYIEIEQNMSFDTLSSFAVEFWIKTSETMNYENDTIFSIYHSGNDYLLDFVMINNSKYLFSSYHKGLTSKQELFLNYNFTPNKYYHIVNQYDGNNKQIYVNGNLLADVSVTDDLVSSNNNIIIGAKNKSDNILDNFRGLIDEVKMYKRSLSATDIRSNYHNFASVAKGCCNYLLLVDPHKFGYNQSSFHNLTSYSTTLFYDYYNKGVNYNITLWNISTLTSNEPSTHYYNLLLDQCVVHAYQILSYQNDSIDIEFPHEGEDGASCSNLIKLGIY